MKISFQYPARVLTAFHYTTTRTYCAETGQRLSIRATSANVYSTRLKTAIVFDRELYLARRAKAVGRMALLACTVAVVSPFVYLGLAFEWVSARLADGTGAALYWLHEHTGFAPRGAYTSFITHWADLTK